MKRYIILTSVLAIAACGGGSHHHDGGPAPVPIEPMTPADVASNKNITQMVSEIDVNNIAYRLNDVDFDTLAQVGDTDEMKILLNANGRISGVQLIGNNTNQTMARNGDTNTFNYNAGNDTATAEYVSYGADVGLKYADFGVMEIDGNRNGVAYNRVVPFAGGYDIKEIDDDLITADATFTGIARGTVTGPNAAKTAELNDNNAKLTFNAATGAEQFSAKFDNWYNVTVDKTARGITANFDDTGKTIDAGLRFKNPPTANMDDGFNRTGTEAIVFDTEYFGDNNTPTEAVALFQYQQAQTADPTQNTNVTIGFGGKK